MTASGRGDIGLATQLRHSFALEESGDETSLLMGKLLPRHFARRGKAQKCRVGVRNKLWLIRRQSNNFAWIGP